jgi:hypothetical protein
MYRILTGNATHLITAFGVAKLNDCNRNVNLNYHIYYTDVCIVSLYKACFLSVVSRVSCHTLLVHKIRLGNAHMGIAQQLWLARSRFLIISKDEKLHYNKVTNVAAYLVNVYNMYVHVHVDLEINHGRILYLKNAVFLGCGAGYFLRETTFLWNIGSHRNYTAPHPRKRHSS